MSENRGPVIYAALVTAAFVLAWVTLFSFERFGATELKAWAPLIQAILSAGAIFSAWWLQDLKRRADRAEAQADNVTAVDELMRILEYQVARALAVAKGDRVSVRLLKLMSSPINNALILLRQQKPSQLPTKRAVSTYISMCNQAALICALLDAELEQAGKEPNAAFPRRQFETLYLNIHSIRGIFLKEINAPTDDNRPPRDVSQLSHWQEIYDKKDEQLQRQ